MELKYNNYINEKGVSTKSVVGFVEEINETIDLFEEMHYEDDLEKYEEITKMITLLLEKLDYYMIANNISETVFKITDVLERYLTLTKTLVKSVEKSKKRNILIIIEQLKLNELLVLIKKVVDLRKPFAVHSKEFDIISDELKQAFTNDYIGELSFLTTMIKSLILNDTKVDYIVKNGISIEKLVLFLEKIDREIDLFIEGFDLTQNNINNILEKYSNIATDIEKLLIQLDYYMVVNLEANNIRMIVMIFKKYIAIVKMLVSNMEDYKKNNVVKILENSDINVFISLLIRDLEMRTYFDQDISEYCAKAKEQKHWFSKFNPGNTKFIQLLIRLLVLNQEKT